MISDSALFLCLAFFNNQSDSNSGILFGIYSNMLSFFFSFFFGYRVKSQSFFFLCVSVGLLMISQLGLGYCA